jgi:hypothetical protein
MIMKSQLYYIIYNGIYFTEQPVTFRHNLITVVYSNSKLKLSPSQLRFFVKRPRRFLCNIPRPRLFFNTLHYIYLLAMWTLLQYCPPGWWRAFVTLYLSGLPAFTSTVTTTSTSTAPEGPQTHTVTVRLGGDYQ